MTQAIAVPLVAFFCLVASVALGMATHGRPAWHMALLPAPTPLLRGVAVGLLALAAMALAMLTVNATSDFRRAQAQAQILAQDATALDETLRRIGPAAEPARTVLYRYTDAIGRRLYPQREALVLAAPAVLDGLRHDLRLEVAALQAEPAAATAATRLEVMLRAGDDLLALTPAPGLKWCRPILVAWLMMALGLLALVSPPRVRNAIVLTSLAGVLSLGLYFLEEMASPFQGSFAVSRAILDDALYVIGD